MYPTSKRPSSGTFVKGEVESLRREGIEVDVLFIDGRDNFLNYLWGIPRLWARLLTRRYDLIHAHYVFCGFISRMQLLYPVVLTHHRPGLVTSWETPLCWIINRLVDSVVDRSLEIKQSRGFSMAEVIPAGIDFDLFKPMSRDECRATLGLPMDKKLVLWAGDYRRREKRFDIVTQTIAQLQRAVPDAELVLITEKPHNVVPQYMNACDVLLLASDGEGSPNVIKEAMACNMPVVSTAVGDVPVVIGDTDGCYLSAQEPQELANKLELALRWGKRTNGRENVKHLELGAIARRFISLYDEIILKKRGKRLARLWIWQKKYRDVQQENSKMPEGHRSVTL
jgi:glycosyltransferase involved in cell wall biosynthesis